MRILLVCALCVGCNLGNVQGCPPKTAAVTADCKSQVAAGKMTKDQCYQLIEASCP
jgi:hypothetical protein